MDFHEAVVESSSLIKVNGTAGRRFATGTDMHIPGDAKLDDLFCQAEGR